MQKSSTDPRQTASTPLFKQSFLPAGLILIGTFLCAWPVLQGMATTSLWNDELFSISRYSSRGASYTVTNYHQPNNHIFFNLLNSVTPAKNRYWPARARFWSYFFTVSTLLVILVYQARVGQLFEGSLQGFFFLANLSYLDLVLQARGYCLLALATTVCTVLTLDYFRAPSLRPLIGIALAVWLGTWTVPTFVLFGAPLFFVLLCYTRDWRWLWAGAGAFVAICIVYWPVRTELFRASQTYGGEWGKAFADWSAIGSIFSTYLVFEAPSWVVFLVVTASVITFLLGRVESAADKAGLCLGLAVLLTFAACLKMETPMKRTVAFVVIPFGFIMITAFARLLHAPRFRGIRSFALYGTAIIALAYSFHVFFTFRYVPYESWLETARKIEDNFPKGTEVFAPFRPAWLQVYLAKAYPVTTRMDPAKLLTGRQIVVDSAPTARQQYPTDQLPKGYALSTVPQRLGKKQRIYYWLPE